jgi:hypothetical protein
MAETAVIAKPSASIPITNSLRLKLVIGCLSGTFFGVFRVARGLDFGLVSSLTLARLRGAVGLFMQASYTVPASIVAHKFIKVETVKLYRVWMFHRQQFSFCNVD